MCCSDPPPPPDLGPSAEASMEIGRMNTQIAREQLDWAREQDTMNREILNEVLSIQMPAMREQYEQARSDRERYETVFRPFEDQFAKEAAEYDTPEKRQQAQAQAIADVSTQFDAQRQNALQRLEEYGVDPSQTRNAALDVGVRTAQAAASAGAASQAGQRVEDVGRALRSDVINMGRGALSNAAGFYGQAVGAGSAGVQGATQTTGAGAGATQSALGFGQLGMQGYGQGANILSQGYGNQMQGYNAGVAQTTGMLQGVGSIAGAAMAIKDGGVIEGEYEEVTEGPGHEAREAAMAVDPKGDVNGPGDGSGIDDQIPAYLSDGEYVIPADVVQAKGEEFFDKLLERYHVPAEQQERQRAIG